MGIFSVWSKQSVEVVITRITIVLVANVQFEPRLEKLHTATSHFGDREMHPTASSTHIMSKYSKVPVFYDLRHKSNTQSVD